jgi:hypothetical protein
MNSRLLSLPTPSTRPWQTLASGVQRIAFWAAVLLPLAYVPLLSAPVDKPELLTLGTLIAVHVCCLLAGHDYSP